MTDKSTVMMKELFGKVREGRLGLSDNVAGRGGDSVLPHSRTPLWSYTPRCICSWFSEGRGMGQRVILLKTIQGILREIQRDGKTRDRGEERLIEADRKERRRVGGVTDQRRYREIR